jgi:hypothetical protein
MLNLMMASPSDDLVIVSMGRTFSESMVSDGWHLIVSDKSFWCLPISWQMLGAAVAVLTNSTI